MTSPDPSPPRLLLLDAYASLHSWCNFHPDLTPHLTFSAAPSNGGIRWAGFKLKRASAHSAVVLDLQILLPEVTRAIARASERLSALLEAPVLEVDMAFDSADSIFLARQYRFALKKIQVRKISTFSVRHAALRARSEAIQALIDFFEGDVIPLGVMCTLNDSFVTMYSPNTPNEPDRIVEYLVKFATRIDSELRDRKKAGWATDFGGFFAGIVRGSRCEREAGYVHPTAAEESLSRYFFNSRSKVKAGVDWRLKSLDRSLSDFGVQVVQFCYELIPNEAHLTPDERSVALLLLARVLFNRCYEILPEVVHPIPDLALNAKLREMEGVPAYHFTLPWTKMPRDCDRQQSIGEVVRADAFLAAASQFLFSTIFDSNPFDCLWRVHRCIRQITKSCVIHGAGGKELARVEEIEMLPFDDLFSIFFAVLIAAQVPDVMVMARMVGDLAPKEGLSPAFEYAQSNLEAVLAHLHDVDVEELRRECPPE
jgi:hypothetical protein